MWAFAVAFVKVVGTNRTFFPLLQVNDSILSDLWEVLVIFKGLQWREALLKAAGICRGLKMTPGSGYRAWAEHHLLVKTCDHFVWSMSESCSKCAKASENAWSVSSAHCELVSSQLVLCEEQWSCAAPGAHTSANCAGVTACSQAFPLHLPWGDWCLCSSSALLVGSWSREQGVIPPAIPCTCLHRRSCSFSLGSCIFQPPLEGG